MRYTFIVVLAILLLFLTGCGGEGGQKAAIVVPSGKGSVDAVLQQQKEAADRQAGADAKKASESSAEEGTAVDKNSSGYAKPVSAKRMKELEESTPRTDVYDLKPTYTKVDYDFSKMNKNLMYTQIYNMLRTPDQYKGKVVRMKGAFGHYYDEKTGRHYYGCIVTDAAACCSTGMEFSRKGSHEYPGNYPKVDEPILVTGKFSSYAEGKQIYCELAEAEIEKL